MSYAALKSSSSRSESVMMMRASGPSGCAGGLPPFRFTSGALQPTRALASASFISRRLCGWAHAHAHGATQSGTNKRCGATHIHGAR
eukprot:4861703-Prymnesium_polylepis.1